MCGCVLCDGVCVDVCCVMMCVMCDGECVMCDGECVSLDKRWGAECNYLCLIVSCFPPGRFSLSFVQEQWCIRPYITVVYAAVYNSRVYGMKL